MVHCLISDRFAISESGLYSLSMDSICADSRVEDEGPSSGRRLPKRGPKSRAQCVNCKQWQYRDQFDKGPRRALRTCKKCVQAKAVAQAKADSRFVFTRTNRRVKTTKKCRRCMKRFPADMFKLIDADNGKRVRRCNSCMEDERPLRPLPPILPHAEFARDVRNRTATYANAHKHKIEYPVAQMSEHLLKVWFRKCAVCADIAHRYVNFGPVMTMIPSNAVPLCRGCCKKHDQDHLAIPDQTRHAIDATLSALRDTDIGQTKYICPVPVKDEECRYPTGAPSKFGVESVCGAEFMIIEEFCNGGRFMRSDLSMQKLIDRPLFPLFMSPEFGVYRVGRFRSIELSSRTSTPLVVILTGSPYSPDKAWGIVYAESSVKVALLHTDTLDIDKILLDSKAEERINLDKHCIELFGAVESESKLLLKVVRTIPTWLRHTSKQMLREVR